MRRKVWFVVLALVVSRLPARAALSYAYPNGVTLKRQGNAGIGFVLGSPMGLSGKYWLKEKQAVQAGFGYGHGPAVYGDMLWHWDEIFPPLNRGLLTAQAGFGGSLKYRNHQLELGPRLVIGADYWTARYPIEFFVELAPTLTLIPLFVTRLDGALGVRFYFRGWPLGNKGGQGEQ
ncbi:MAG: hypothetical protein AAB091_02125 [Elusimicrobiota bacterium]